MKIGIIGAGNVGRALGQSCTRVGHRVAYGVREPASEKYRALGGESEVLSVRDTVAQCDVAVLATPWDGTQAALTLAGDFGGKPLLDATNPIGKGFVLTQGHTDSGGEQVARWAKNARVVKVFNTTGVENMLDPVFGDSRATMFVCGDDEVACSTAAALARELGFETLQIGALKQARILEPAAMLWINLAMVVGQERGVAFHVLKREHE